MPTKLSNLKKFVVTHRIPIAVAAGLYLTGKSIQIAREWHGFLEDEGVVEALNAPQS